MLKPPPMPHGPTLPVLATILLSLGLPRFALAEEPGMTPISPELSLLKAVGALILIIGLLLLLAALVKKMGINRGFGKGGGLIRVVETRSLGPRKYLAVVEGAGEFFLLGVSDQQISLLTPLNNQELIRQELIRQNPTQGSADNESSGFAAYLANVLKQRNPKE